jgi:excisionase family DNA binding protein
MPKSPIKDILTVDELATYLKVPKSTVYKLAQEGTLPGQKVGRHWRFQRQAIDQWMNGSTEARRKSGEVA